MGWTELVLIGVGLSMDAAAISMTNAMVHRSRHGRLVEMAGWFGLLQALMTAGGWLLGGLFPVVSEKNARFLQSEVAGIALDDAVIRAYEGLNREQGEAMAVRLCTQAARRIAPYVNGFYIMTPFQRVALVQRVISAVRGL